MKINQILKKESIDVNCLIEEKDKLLDYLIELIDDKSEVFDRKQAKKDVLERESIMSTGVGKGIALPHAKTNASQNSSAALCIIRNPIDFDSLDGEPVNIAFLLLGPENNVGLHLKLLSKVSRLLNNDSFRLQLLDCKSSDDVLKLFNSMEEV